MVADAQPVEARHDGRTYSRPTTPKVDSDAIGGPHAEPLGVGDRAANLIEVEDCRRRYMVDRNPLRVFHAMHCLAAAYRGASHLPLPAWMADYLGAVGVELHALADEVTRLDNKAPAAHALGRLPRALGMTRPGWSAFAALRQERLADEARHEFMTAFYTERVPMNVALDRAAKASGRGAEDPAQRRSQAKKLIGLAQQAEPISSSIDEDFSVLAHAEAERIIGALAQAPDKT